MMGSDMGRPMFMLLGRHSRQKQDLVTMLLYRKQR
jgi:hypothetical protein